MRPLLAHQGGWDEMLLAGTLVLAMLGFSRLRRRASGRPPPPPSDPSVCSYCGAPLEPSDERCGACGFRIVRPPSG